MSLPLRECGLKYLSINRIFYCVPGHSPCGSVDWNGLLYADCHLDGCHSPCGSVDWNHARFPVTRATAPSLPLRECGLKYHNCNYMHQNFCHSPCGSVDWNSHIAIAFLSLLSHSPCGSVDWNQEVTNIFWFNTCHSPCGSVDWNFCPRLLPVEELLLSLPLRECGLKYQLSMLRPDCFVTPLAGVWIEIACKSSAQLYALVTPLAGVWIEIKRILKKPA